jgi:hypothetical protein
MAKRYDEWSGTDYEGSSARGAMKGWHKHGVCRESLWRQREERPLLKANRAEDAGRRPLGAYYRVNHKDLVAMHASLAEVGILYASAQVHGGWENVGNDGIIRYDPRQLGGHAFVIVGYDEEGMWIQNSWGPTWGKRGFGRIGYDDWLDNGQDVWVARLAVPVRLRADPRAARGVSLAARQRSGYSYHDLRPHVVSIGNDGELSETGTYGTSREEIESIVMSDLPDTVKKWKKPRVLLYAHGGLTTEETAIERIADYRHVLLDAEVYPIAFVWRTGFWSTLKNILTDAVSRRRTEGWLDDAKDFMLDRLDDTLEPIARALTGKAQWDEMKENAILASQTRSGGARFLGDCLAKLVDGLPNLEIHVAGHSAGSIFLAPLVQYLATKGTIPSGPMKNESGLGLRIKTCALMAPAITLDLFFDTYLPLIESERIRRVALYTLDDETEQDDHCVHTYHKSLLYLVSNAFEEQRRIPIVSPEGEPLLGMEKFLNARNFRGKVKTKLERLHANPRFDWIRTPNQKPVGNESASTARSHPAFDEDVPTVTGVLRRILGKKPTTKFAFFHSDEAVRDRRTKLN